MFCNFYNFKLPIVVYQVYTRNTNQMKKAQKNFSSGLDSIL
ncbi:hypothetical protein HMPREF9514_01463 [Enterococcus faecalis TX0855]|nr:hypothetical protein HMPREF9514_01463 [Enterococcus faecalis TX0855]